MTLKFIAQSGFLITTDSGKVIAIDLWLDNPLNKLGIDTVPKVDYVFITHDHFDHGYKDGIQIALRDQSNFISNQGIVEAAKKEGVVKTFTGNIGESFSADSVQITFVRADHPGDFSQPVGIIMNIDGKVIYHMGDTTYFPELKELGTKFNINLLLIPIGGTFTMNPDEATKAVLDLHPKRLIPIHYNTFDQIRQDPGTFSRIVVSGGSTVEVIILEPDQEFNF